MKSSFIKRIFKKPEPESFYFDEEEVDEITDEIEKSLWLLKEEYDFPTEEIERSVESRYKSINRFISSH